jgi:hypothetical protein
MKYYQVNVELRTEDEKGKIKKTREQYLVQGVSCLDAETTTNKKYEQEGNNLDYTIKQVKETKFLEVL